MPCLVFEPPCVSWPRSGLSNRLAHVVSSSIASFASPGLTHILHLRGWRQSGATTARCVFYAAAGRDLESVFVWIPVKKKRRRKKICENKKRGDSKESGESKKMEKVRKDAKEGKRELTCDEAFTASVSAKVHKNHTPTNKHCTIFSRGNTIQRQGMPSTTNTHVSMQPKLH